MINRHLLRIKVLQIAYAYFTRGGSIDLSLKELDKSIRQTRELYLKLLLLPLELQHIAEQKFHNQQQSTRQKEGEISVANFVNNSFLQFLKDSKTLHTFCTNEKISWAGQEGTLLSMYYQFLEMPFFKKYLGAPTQDAKEDQRIIYTFFSKFLTKKTNIDSIIEEQNLYWNDDLWIVLPMLQQAVKKMDVAQGEFPVPGLYRQEGDEDFAKDLFLKIVRLEEEMKVKIQEVTTNWEYGRIALIDRILLAMGIVELLHFETIPVKVTLNEYVEISKYYSTENSSTFINGILDKIAKKEDAASLKKGAGRIGNN